MGQVAALLIGVLSMLVHFKPGQGEIRQTHYILTHFKGPSELHYESKPNIQTALSCSLQCAQTKHCQAMEFDKQTCECLLLFHYDTGNSEAKTFEDIQLWFGTAFCPPPMVREGNVRNVYNAATGVTNSTCINQHLTLSETKFELRQRKGGEWDDLKHLKCGEVDRNCKATRGGHEYMGTIAVSRMGKTCANWTDQVDYSDKSFPELSRKDAGNYCRNPAPGMSSPDSPWCNAIDPSDSMVTSVEACIVPICDDSAGQADSASGKACIREDQECKKDMLGLDYQGTTSVTSSGTTCQRWDSQNPHDPYSNLPKETAHNHCRNPDSMSGGPWCYTTDPGTRWDYCDVPICQNASECKKDMLGLDYQGPISVTRYGMTCQRWDSQTAHNPSGNVPKETTHNQCRNPDGTSGGPWCYTTDPATRWDYCDVPVCQTGSACTNQTMCKTSRAGWEYTGKLNMTIDGHLCQRWDELRVELQGTIHDLDFLERNMTLAENHCRNPDKSDENGPWCFTNYPTKQYCQVQYCDSVYDPLATNV